MLPRLLVPYVMMVVSLILSSLLAKSSAVSLNEQIVHIRRPSSRSHMAFCQKCPIASPPFSNRDHQVSLFFFTTAICFASSRGPETGSPPPPPPLSSGGGPLVPCVQHHNMQGAAACTCRVHAARTSIWPILNTLI